MDCRRLCSWGVGPCCGQAAGADLRFLGCAGRASVLRLLGPCVPAGGHGFTERGIGEGGWYWWPRPCTGLSNVLGAM